MSSVIRDRDRLAALRATGLLDNPAEPAFGRLGALAARVTGALTALVAFVDGDRHASDWRDKERTGIGSRICKSIAEQQGGTFTMDSTVSAGSTFTVRIPQ